ncbi:type II secretion system minor pseudopilin GspI [Pseudidiomarina taiwanensis]|uniref:Type II secretion system protein I n=1 Tax=Pseudidiomarina taiwanensis TaxID=337250 RepID=A0A432ZKS0_9GAMM|nr:type II secretion system minor pseudopilin GspI [Pseudidiomarina taiwanensis]RUO78430.1 type II secretion system protein GspI [Pseudidiomarina taiwanensis]
MNKRASGFTLIEVLAAMAIFALIAVAAIAAATQHVDSLRYMEQKTFARMAASNAISRISLSYPPQDGASGLETIGDIEWRWRSEVVETATENVFFVTVRVSEESDRTEAEVLFELSRYMGPEGGAQ